MSPFEIEWLGGLAERQFRRLRPEVADLPWGSLRPGDHAPELVDAARIRWTRIAASEYRAAVAFSHLLQTLLEARAPLDVVGMASDFVADELSHVEIASRVAMALGGAAPIHVPPEALSPLTSAATEARSRAHEEVVRLCFVHEALSRALVTHTVVATTDPLLRSAEQLIARDESMHVRLGAVYFEWASELLDGPERERLARAAERELTTLASLWRGGETAPSRFTREQVVSLGWLDAESQRRRVERAILEEIVPALAAYGIVIEPNGTSNVLP